MFVRLWMGNIKGRHQILFSDTAPLPVFTSCKFPYGIHFIHGFHLQGTVPSLLIQKRLPQASIAAAAFLFF